MQPPAQAFPILSFIGVVIQMGGALLLIALFALLRQFVLRRAYFRAWSSAWTAMAVAIAAVVIRYILMPEFVGSLLDERHPVTMTLYFIYQMCKGLALIYFLRGTLMYVTGQHRRTARHAASLGRRRGLRAGLDVDVGHGAQRNGRVAERARGSGARLLCVGDVPASASSPNDRQRRHRRPGLPCSRRCGSSTRSRSHWGFATRRVGSPTGHFSSPGSIPTST